MDLRWGIGVYLGTLMTSNEAVIALPDGEVTRSRAVARLVPSQRWRKEAILAIKGTPARPRPTNHADDARVEAFANPHLSIDAELREKLEKHAELALDLPEWWVPGKHDHDLVVGAARYVNLLSSVLSTPSN